MAAVCAAGIAADDPLPVVDISEESARQVVIAEGAKDRYEGHPTTLLADDGRTMFCVWTTGHGGPCGQMARSEDGGLTWTRMDAELPAVYGRTHRNCPVLQKLRGPDGKVRYFVYSAKVREGRGLGILMSEDLGRTWTEQPCQPQLSAGMPPTGVMELGDGTIALFGQVRRNRAVKTDRPTDDQDVWMALSTDGGRTYGEMRTVMTAENRNLCEPCCLRSPDGRSLVLLARENRHKGCSMMSFSHDEGKSWTAPVDTPWALTGDRHEGVLLPDGRYVIAFRDQAVGSPTRGQFMAWVGTFDDLLKGRPGQCRIHLLRHHFINRFPGGKGDTGYPGVELLPDGTVVCTTYSRHFADDRQSSVVSTRFTIGEIDRRLAQRAVP
ncbi:MAG: sialidase family protein [Kiritimatiellae bacterium]|nr:sialidase family protein [Kiritimatiellia bacterium]